MSWTLKLAAWLIGHDRQRMIKVLVACGHSPQLPLMETPLPPWWKQRGLGG